MWYVFRSHLGSSLRQVDRGVLWNGACAAHPTASADCVETHDTVAAARGAPDSQPPPAAIMNDNHT